MDVSQLYMLALRPTMVPIVGESTDDLFIGQVEIESWSWDFHNLEEMKRIKNDPDRNAYEERKKELDKAESKRLNEDFDNELQKLESGFFDEDLDAISRKIRAEDRRQDALSAANKVLTDADRDKRKALLDERDRIEEARKSTMERFIDKAESFQDKQRRLARERIENDRSATTDYASKNFQFKFSKRVDAATTQLLNCMKAGDLLPTVTLTMHQASSNTPWSLVITVTKMRLLKYELKVEVTDTMSDMREDWEAEFASFGYVYQNRPHAGTKAMTAGHVNTAVARSMTQATVRTFMMKNLDFF